MAMKNEAITAAPTAWALLIWLGPTCINIPPSAVMAVAKFALAWLASQRPQLYQQLLMELNDKPPSA